MVKVKLDTSELKLLIAKKLEVCPADFKDEFDFFWRDLDISFSYFIGYSTEMLGFCRFKIKMESYHTKVVELEKMIYKKQKILIKYNELLERGIPMHVKINWCRDYIAHTLSKIIFINCSIKDYENEVLSVYPNKKKPNYKVINRCIARLEQFYNVPFSKLPVAIEYPIQKAFVRSMQRKGLLPNPILYKGKPLPFKDPNFKYQNKKM
jgi:hypothetical protein